MDAADSITILRDGMLVDTLDKADTTPEKLAAMMIGRGDESVIQVEKRANQIGGEIAMSIRDLWVNMPGEYVKGVDMDVRQGAAWGF